MLNSWKNGVSKLVLSLIFLVSFFSFQSSTYAASVGQALPSPETSWQRIEDTNSAFVYEGPSWGTYTNNPLSSGLTQKYTLSPALHTVKFSFVGKNIRMIGYRGLDRQTSINIKIDDIQYSYSANGSAQAVTLLFEKLGLENKLHSVEVSVVNSGTYSIFDFDAVDIDKDGYVIVSTIIAPKDLKAVGSDSNVDLSWIASSNATSYNVKRSTTAGGPYETLVTNVTDTVYTDASVINNTTYYYVVTALNANGQSIYSNEASAKPQGVIVPDPEPSGDRAILTVTLTNGLEKEFDLSIEEVDAFLDWYDARDAGTGLAKFAIDKHNNNKGPFSSRKEYVIFDKILTFSVDEYSVE